MNLRPSTAHLLAAAISLSLNLQLRWADQLGFYDIDYNHLWNCLYSDRALAQSWKNLGRHLLTDEPLFHVYHAVRYHVLGASPLPHHLLAGTLVAANAVLAFSLVWRMSGQYLFTFAFLFLFLTYPNRGEAHYWPGAVYAPMLLCLLAAAQLAQRGRYRAAWAAYTAAVFTHEAAFGFLAVMAVVLWRRWRWLGLMALSNAAYLVVRQTRWFGLGEQGFLYERRIHPGQVFANLRYSLDVTFGGTFLARTEQALREGVALQNMLPALLLILGTLLAVAALALLAVIGGATLYTRQTPVPDLALALPLLLRAAVLLALGAAVVTRLWPAANDRAGALLRLGAFGGLWFLAGYAPTYVLYIAPRHGYLPSVGICLLLAAVLWLPAACAADERRRRWLEGAALAMAAYIAVGLYAACLGEGARWTGAAAFTSRLRAQVLRATGSLPRDARVVILGVPLVWKEAPLLPGYALQAALRHWTGRHEIVADREFVPRREDFVLPGSAPQPYDRLILFTYHKEVLQRVDHLLFEDGATVRLGAPPEGGSGITLRVAAGRPLGH